MTMAAAGRRKALYALTMATLTAVVSPLRAFGARPFRVGVLSPGFAERQTAVLGVFPALSADMAKLGLTEGRDITYDVRFVGGDSKRLPVLAAELVRSKPDALVTQAAAATLALAKETSKIPILTVVTDPVELGLTKDLSRPSGNVAGINNRHADVVAKQIETLKRILPKLNEFGLFGLEGDPHSELVYQRYEKLQQTAGIKTHRVMFRNVEDARAAFASRAKGVKVGAEVSMFPQIMTGKEFASLAAANGIVTVSSEGAEDGVFMSLDTDYAAARFRLAEMLVKVLHGTPLSEIPFEQPTKYYLAFNMKTAKALGITIPPEVLLRADQLHE